MDDQPKPCTFPSSIPDDKLALNGTRTVDYEKAIPSEGSSTRFNYQARTLNLVLSGQEPSRSPSTAAPPRA